MSSSARVVILTSAEDVTASIPDDPHQHQGNCSHCLYLMFGQLSSSKPVVFPEYCQINLRVTKILWCFYSAPRHG